LAKPYTRETLDQPRCAICYETELFADVQIRDNAGVLTVTVKENPVINRIVLEGNKRVKEDKIRPEIKLAPREIYTRSKVRADVRASSSCTSARAALPPASSRRW
jgi:outer membrane protein insertion porin family